ncbi:20S proteasome subunit alpha 3 [Pancytospora philotis]|nr:20S proteasome subunit alpha 3 [Pancytospora philotis]KAI4291970.1 20S proteasome subunit alpha 3 [Pancytospora philotis]
MSEHETKSNSFTDDGRLQQVEYAIKGVSEAGTTVGLVCTDGVVLVGINPAPTQLREKIYRLNSSTYCLVAGIFSDSMRLVKYARLASAKVKDKICADPRTSVVCELVAREKQLYTQRAGARPFGVSFLYCGHEDDEYALYSTDPSGSINRWRAWAFGTHEDVINGTLRNELPPQPLPLEQGVAALFKILTKARENPPDLAQRMEILLYQRDSARFMSTGDIEALIDRAESEVKAH